jgi:hypothetical protein
MRGVSLFDHLVGAQQKGFGNGEAERSCGRQLDEMEFGRLLRDLGWLASAQDLVHEIGGASRQAGEVRAIGRKASRLDVFSQAKDRRQRRLQRQRVDLYPVSPFDRIGGRVKSIGAALECVKAAAMSWGRS